jgi:hypothetical protein
MAVIVELRIIIEEAEHQFPESPVVRRYYLNGKVNEK